LELLYHRFPQWQPGPPEDGIPVPYVPLAFGNSRALVKIEDGCNMHCSFCIIPMTRGAQSSRPLTEVLQEVKALVESGHRELVITGVQISSYRWRQARLYNLVRSVLETTDIERVRLTSIAPWDFDPRLVDLVEEGRVCRHFHLSLQSGCDRTLAAMRRPYTTDQYRHLAEELRSRVPGLAITTDVIVGFPGESENDFQTSLEFVEELEFARIHAFPYSPRPGTAAAGLPRQVDSQTSRRRMQRMLQVAAASQRRFDRSQIGETVAVLWETRRNGVWVGTSDNYLRVEMNGNADVDAGITATRIECLTELGVAGRSPGTTARPTLGTITAGAVAQQPTAA
jgi:threonylcarbamoyladenosine tRNA methylthiotransferase MtaB